MRRAAKTDTNQQEIVAALRGVGASVLLLHQVGHDAPDLLVGYRGFNYLLECKAERWQLSPGQRNFMLTWRGGAPMEVRSAEEALRVIGVIG